MIPQYREASSVKRKSKLLDAFTATTGYNRKYASMSTSTSTRECRSQLLSMSATTADRLPRSQRKVDRHGLSTTRAGTLLKQQIPIRTFEEWNEARPGFLAADLVAHCGTDIEGGYLYTLTFTDVATGWTECLPLLYRSQETVLAALQRARTLFPFPMLGIDTDNGGEFLNEEVAAYCAREQMTFTGIVNLEKVAEPCVKIAS